jgi:hypothetical protein
MHRTKQLALAVAAGLAVAAAPAVAADENTKSQANPDVVEGQVTSVDAVKNRVVIRGGDGRNHEFEASPETVKDLKPGDRIEAKRRKTE